MGISYYITNANEVAFEAKTMASRSPVLTMNKL